MIIGLIEGPLGSIDTMHEDRYLLDFWDGPHGHFLEYVINCWIFDCPRVPNLFTHTRACHGAKNKNLTKNHTVVANAVPFSIHVL